MCRLRGQGHVFAHQARTAFQEPGAASTSSEDTQSSSGPTPQSPLGTEPEKGIWQLRGQDRQSGPQLSRSISTSWWWKCRSET